MVNDLKIKTNWIITLCMVFCSLTSFSQNFSDKEIGFDANRTILSLKAHGVKSEYLASKVSFLRKTYTDKHIADQKSKDVILQKITSKQTVNKSTKKTAKVSTSKASAEEGISQAERNALIAFYYSTDGPNWKNKYGWDTLSNLSISVTSLSGVTIENGTVTKINFFDNNLKGTIPAAIGQLTNLQELTLYDNELSGSIPAEIGQLTNLIEINLSRNQLTGAIPAEIGQLQNLETLNCYNNQLSGALPAQIGQLTKITNIGLGYNNITSIPAEIGQLQNLGSLSLYSNQLTGNITKEIGQLNNLQYLELYGNQLTGTIPTELFSLQNLEYLGLRGNQLSGTIPVGISQLQNLIRLELTSNELTGTIPTEIGQLANLESLDLGYNQLTGSIPVVLGSLTKLTNLSLSGNQLSGTIPPEIGQLSNLTGLYLVNNLLSGTIPPQLGQLSNLVSLYIGSNSLTGSIPTEFTSLSKLRILNVDTNKLQGYLPDLTGLPELYYIDISTNKFRFIDFAAQFAYYNNLYAFKYYNQGYTDEEKTINTTTGKSLTIEMYSDGRFTGQETYQWYKSTPGLGHFIVSGATSRQLVIPSLRTNDTGYYDCFSAHPEITIYGGDQSKNLTLFSYPVHVNVTDCSTVIVGTIKTTAQNPAPNENINFSFDTSNTNLTYKWTFYNLDNVTEIGSATTAQVSRSYSAEGTYKINLVVTDQTGCDVSFEKIITIAKFCPPIVGKIGKSTDRPDLNWPLNFYLSSTTTNTNLTYKWTFYNADNTVKEIQTTADASQTYTQNGDYIVNLAVTDTVTDCTTTITDIITFSNCEYTWNRNGDIYFPNEPLYGNNGVFINTASTIAFGRYRAPLPNLTYEWNLYDANAALVKSGNTINFSFTLTKPENYKLKLRVSDNQGCTNYEKTIPGRDPNACVILPSDRFQGNLDIETYYRGIPVNVEQEMALNNPSGYNASNFTFKWELYNAAGLLINSGNQPGFPITLTEIKEYKLTLEIKDLNGCVTNYTKLITPIDTCTYTEEDRSGYIATDNSPYNNGIAVYANEPNNLSFYSYGISAENLTYQWELINPKGVSIGTSNEAIFPLNLPKGGTYQIKLKVTDPLNGCTTEHIQDIECLITDSCTNDNPKSQKVLEFYVDLLVNLISRSIQGETDAQINASEPTAEFTALKPYLTNGPKDKIYNFTSVIQPNEGGIRELKEISFSFSPDREYDVNVVLGWRGISFDPKQVTLSELQTEIRDVMYTDLSQYISSEQFILSCKSEATKQTNGKKKDTKTARDSNDPDSPLYYCDFGSQIRHINFCPGQPNTCDPEIVGMIKSDYNSNRPIITNKDISFTFDTTASGLTYTWSITTNEGELVEAGPPDVDVTIPYVYKFKYEGTYIIKVIAKDQTGCTATFRSSLLVMDEHCANQPYGFKFETAEPNLTYRWTATDDNDTIVHTETNTTGLFIFTPTTAGHYEINLFTSGTENCDAIFSEDINVLSCSGGSVSCTKNNPLTLKVHGLFMDLINKLVSTPNGADVNAYAQNEIAAFVPYTMGKGGKIYKFVNTNTYVSFSFSDDTFKSDVTLPKSATGTITSIDLSRFYGPQATTAVITNYSDGTTNSTSGNVENINFCPAQECTPLVGTISIVKRNTNATKPVSTVLPTKTYKYEGIWLSNATQQPEVNAWVDYKDASGVQKRTVIGAITDGCKEIIASSIVNTNGVDICSNCQELHVESQNTELCYKVTYLDCSGQIKTLVTDATTVFPGKRIISAVQQACNSTSPPPPVETSKTTTTSTSSRI